MRTAIALWSFIDSEVDKLSAKVQKLVGTCLVRVIYVSITESDSQAISGSIQDGTYVELYSIIGGSTNILLVRDFI